MSEDIFSTFNPVSKEEWIAKINKDLKGKDFNSTLQWHTDEGIVIDPIYHSEDIEQTNKDNYLLSGNSSWVVLEKVKFLTTAEAANKLAIAALNNGAEGVVFDCQQTTINYQFCETLCADILLDIAPVYIVNFSGKAPSYNGPMFQRDEITEQLVAGQLIEDFKTQDSIFIKGSVFQNAGAKIIEQLAIILALGNEYLNQCEQTDSLSKLKEVQIEVAIGSNFFFEIAKLRALKQLWAVIAKQYKVSQVPLKIFATNTKINKSNLDPYNNMLRNTTECMSAVIGGANAIQINAHDETETEVSKRWARNISQILKHESYFDQVEDAAKGSYYVEKLTEEFGRKAWVLFQQIEQQGGFLNSWKSGFIPNLIAASRKAQEEAFAKGEKVILGVNKFAEKGLEMKTVKSPVNVLSQLNLASIYE